MRKRIDIKIIIAITFVLFLILPFIHRTLSFEKIAPLEGAFILKNKPAFGYVDWFSGKYQMEAEEYLNENFGFRDILVRLNNQIVFSFFRKANAEGIVVGRNNYLFQKPGIVSYYGRDFLGEDVLEQRIERLKFLNDTLAKLNKNLIIILGTGKGSFYPEYIPEKFRTRRDHTNIEYYSDHGRSAGLHIIDFNKYFIELKKTSKYPLYPQYGIHWSRYVGGLVVDSVIHYIESIRNIDLPDLVIDTIEWRQPEKEDYDIAGGMNLLFRMKSFNMAYPKFHYESDSGKTKPAVLVIGDSFYWELSNMEISNAFSKNEFWYYNKRGTAGAFKDLSQSMWQSMAEEVNNFEVVILICTESNLPELGWGFIENTYCYYKGISLARLDEMRFQERVASIKIRLSRDKSKMDRITEMAKRKNISVDSMITFKAIEKAKKMGSNK